MDDDQVRAGRARLFELLRDRPGPRTPLAPPPAWRETPSVTEFLRDATQSTRPEGRGRLSRLFRREDRPG